MDEKTLNPQNYKQIHTPTVVQGEVGGTPSLGFAVFQYFRKILHLVEAFDVLYKKRYILRVVALLGDCDAIPPSLVHVHRRGNKKQKTEHSLGINNCGSTRMKVNCSLL